MISNNTIPHVMNVIDLAATQLSSICSNVDDNNIFLQLQAIVNSLYQSYDDLKESDNQITDPDIADVVHASQFLWMLLRDIANNYDNMSKEQLQEFVGLYTGVDGKFNPYPDELSTG